MSPRRLIATFAACATVCVASGILYAGCSESSRRGVIGLAVLPPQPNVIGIVVDYTDRQVENVPVQVLGTSTSAPTRIDGLAALGLVPQGSQILRVGDSVNTPTLLVPFTQPADSAFLHGPVFMPSLESGISSTFPASVTTTSTLTGNNLAGVTLTVNAGTTISNFNGTLTVVGVAPSRLPVPTPIGEPRAAYLVEPHGATFSPVATLTVPRLDSVSATFDAYKVDRTTGQWVLDQVGITTGANDHTFDVDEGTLWAVVPQAASATVSVTGRVVSGTVPVQGYIATCWGRTSPPSAADGTFTISGVPTAYGAYLVFAQPQKPGVEFAPEVSVTISTSPNLTSDLQVTARLPDAIPPSVRVTNPREGQTNVSRSTDVTVTFSEAVDTTNTQPFKLIGPSGDVAGQISYDNAFTARFRTEENLDPSEDYNILVSGGVRDLAGNGLDSTFVNFRFTTRGGTPDPPPTDTQAFGLTPLVASRGDSINIPGRNYTGGSVVTFGGTAGTVTSETPDLIEVTVPDFVPAGDVTVALSAGGAGIGTLQPLVLDLRSTVSTIFDDTTLTNAVVFIDRAAPPTDIVVNGGNTGATAVTVDSVAITAADFTQLVGGVTVTTGRQITFAAPAPATLLTGPVVLRGANGEPGSTYRFLHVRD